MADALCGRAHLSLARPKIAAHTRRRHRLRRHLRWLTSRR
ncbi:hypothetical protein C357_18287 [Citreicella sp. 357]|nr:hypothetical protein C357_18287 [Citreicella sp. 357]